MARFAVMIWALAASGCNCSADTSGLADPDASFTPLDAAMGSRDAAPLRDATVSVDAGMIDAGFADAGGTQCLTASDCHGPSLPSVSFCPDSRYSCIEGACVWECHGPRTCAIDASECAVCDGQRTCPGAMCGISMGMRGHIEQATDGCKNLPGTSTPFDGSELMLFSTARPCSTGIELAGTPSFIGAFLEHEQGQSFAFFPVLGGRCSGFEAPTGALRFVFSCPACQFVVGP